MNVTYIITKRQNVVGKEKKDELYLCYLIEVAAISCTVLAHSPAVTFP